MEHSAACRILVISSTTAQALQFVQRVKAVTDKSRLDVASDDAAFTNTTDSASSSIPWTITNKYYTADVHFETREYEAFVGYHASEVPAVIYVWSRGDPYKEHVSALAGRLQHHDPEVSLAVRLGTVPPVPPKKEEEDGLDEFLSSHGFEYIDAGLGGRQPTGDGGSFSDEDSSGIPGLPRVIDALSTIMWPSLVQSPATTARKSRARELLDWARQEEAEDGLRALITPAEQDGGSSGGNDPRKSRMQREMEELERWLEEEDVGRRKTDDAEAWGARYTDDGAGSWSDVPTPLVRTPGPDDAFGFEDDFAEFVGAPVDVTYEVDSVRSHHTGASYRTLASNPEFGGEDVFGEEGDPDLPSRVEIEETSKRIFGTTLDVPSKEHGSRSPRKHSENSSLTAPAPSSSGQHDEHVDIPYRPLDHDSFSVDYDVDEDDFELGAFDLSRVLGALQGMKDEIAGMESEDERRRAAARVALGLVYGLQKEDERGEF